MITDMFETPDNVHPMLHLHKIDGVLDDFENDDIIFLRLFDGLCLATSRSIFLEMSLVLDCSCSSFFSDANPIASG